MRRERNGSARESANWRRQKLNAKRNETLEGANVRRRKQSANSNARRKERNVAVPGSEIVRRTMTEILGAGLEIGRVIVSETGAMIVIETAAAAAAATVENADIVNDHLGKREVVVSLKRLKNSSLRRIMRDLNAKLLRTYYGRARGVLPNNPNLRLTRLLPPRLDESSLLLLYSQYVANLSRTRILRKHPSLLKPIPRTPRKMPRMQRRRKR